MAKIIIIFILLHNNFIVPINKTFCAETETNDALIHLRKFALASLIEGGRLKERNILDKLILNNRKNGES